MGFDDDELEMSDELQVCANCQTDICEEDSYYCSDCEKVVNNAKR